MGIVSNITQSPYIYIYKFILFRLRSTRNTRIERLWVEVGTQFARCWQGFFTRLEKMHMLDPQNPHHVWLLHLLFLDDINNDCNDFKEEWNCHPISGPDTSNKSPKVNSMMIK